MDGVGEQLWVCMSLLGSTSSAWSSTVTLYVPPSVSCSASPSFFTFLLVFCCGAISHRSAVSLLLKYYKLKQEQLKSAASHISDVRTCLLCFHKMYVCGFSGVGWTEQSLTGSLGNFFPDHMTNQTNGNWSESDGFYTGRLVSVHERHEADKDVSHDSVCITTFDRLSLRPTAAVIADVLVNASS